MKTLLSLLPVLVGAAMLGACGAPSDASPSSSSTTANLTTAPAAPAAIADGKCTQTEANADACGLAGGRGQLWTCEVANAPPKARPACMPAGGHKSWCCF
jgi:hypothetical protein